MLQTKSSTPAVPISQYGLVFSDIPYFYKTLNCTGGKETGRKICLHLIYIYGFFLSEIKSNVKNKVWWEGNNPGSKIEFYLQEPCTKILILHNLSVVTIGMVRV